MQYYRDWCDTKIPMFEEKTPREIIKTEEGRKKVRELLLSMESDELRKQKEGEEYIPVEKIIREELGFYD